MTAREISKSNSVRTLQGFHESPKEWPWNRLESLCSGVFDCPHSTPIITTSGPYLARTQDISTGIFRQRNAVHVSEATYVQRTSRVIPSHGDLIYSREGTYFGVAAEVPNNTQVCLGQRMVLIRPDPRAVHFRFLRYWLNSPAVASFIHGQRDGSVAERLNLPTIRALPVLTPTLPEQQAIAEILGALDDKIAVNERIAETTATLSRAMMQSLWKQGGVSSVTTDQDLTAPGWTRTTLGELCAKGGGSIQTGPFGSQLHASDYVETGIPSVMPQNIGENIISEKGIARITNADALRLSKYLLTEGDVVYSRRGDVKRRALVRRHESGWLCGTGCLRVRAGNAVEPLFLSHYLGEPEVQNWIQQHAVGATMPNLNTSILGAVPVVLPASDVRSRINEKFSALDARSISAISENKTLTALRDTLLPQLVTGKLRIKDAERAVEDAV